jgi:hypothetical protein
VKDFVVLDNQLSGAQMPPQVRISHATRRHGEKTERQNDHEQAARLKKFIHPAKDTLQF